MLKELIYIIFKVLNISQPIIYLFTILLTGIISSITLIFNKSSNDIFKQKILINYYIILFIIIFGGIFIIPPQIGALPNESPSQIWNNSGIVVFILIKSIIESYAVLKRPIPLIAK